MQSVNGNSVCCIHSESLQIVFFSFNCQPICIIMKNLTYIVNCCSCAGLNEVDRNTVSSFMVIEGNRPFRKWGKIWTALGAIDRNDSSGECN